MAEQILHHFSQGGWYHIYSLMLLLIKFLRLLAIYSMTKFFKEN